VEPIRKTGEKGDRKNWTGRILTKKTLVRKAKHIMDGQDA
jgi:hypothetical protein